ncbi:iron ABC transporter permease, partial [Streptomyces cyaneofuscatus]
VVVLCADQPARLALAPVETPVGAWTALVGVPVGVVLLKRGRRAAKGRGPTRAALPVQGGPLGARPVDDPVPLQRKAER